MDDVRAAEKRRQLDAIATNAFAEFQLIPDIDKKVRNNTDVIKEEIWDIVEKENPEASRKMFFIKVSKLPDNKLLEYKKWALTTDNFCRAFYGMVKKWNKQHDLQIKK